MARKTHEPYKVAAVIGDLLLGKDLRQIARTHKISHNTVLAWARKANINRHVIAVESRETLGQLVDDYLRKSLKALSAQAEFAAGSEYLQSQSADNVASLHNAIDGQAIRVLGALQDDNIPVQPATLAAPPEFP